MKKVVIIFIVTILALLSGCTALIDRQKPKGQPDSKEKIEMSYAMPAEALPHEGTWLTWPHPYTYGKEYQKEVEMIWVQMTQALHHREKVHIVAYDKQEQTHIKNLLSDSGVNLEKVDFVIAKSNDVWARDTGPIFVIDKNNKLTIADFGFDGWGEKVAFEYDDQIAAKIGKEKSIPIIDISDFILEGGSVEVDGNGTLMACLSSVVSKNRNPRVSITQAEEQLSQYLGVTNFIWLDGVTDEDITDAHIDGMARFLDDRTILTVSKEDFIQLYETIQLKDYRTLQNARNAKGKPYQLIELPLTKKNAKGLDYKGSYLNYYVGNAVVLVPIYKDDNDAIALEIIADLYPQRKIVPILVNDLFQYGGMLHCVTQQQPETP